MAARIRLIASFLCSLLPVPGHGLPPLQLLIELTPPGGILQPPPGTYRGPIDITRPITLDGRGEVTIDAQGSGSALRVRAKGSVIRGLHLTGSGEVHDNLDAGLQLEADECLIEDNRIDDVLFGIHLKQAHDNLIRRNRITSKPLEPSLRGEGIRLWYSHGNRIENNAITGVRDLVLANSSDNQVSGNAISDSRIGIELIFAHENRIEGNRIERNATGIVVLYSDDVVIGGNRLAHLRSSSGAALSLKESSGILLEDNEILHCAVGLSANAPIHPENTFELRGNRFAYNDIALYFYGEKGGHHIVGNRFEENFTNVAVSHSLSARFQTWEHNRWDDYEGFDLDRDGVGDTPHQVHAFADRIWLDRPMTRFFRGSPLLGVIDFVERLAPFSPPQLILQDPTPATR